MIKKIFSLAILTFFLLTCGYALAGPGKPDFSPNVYADGIAWGTKGTTAYSIPGTPCLIIDSATWSRLSRYLQ